MKEFDVFTLKIVTKRRNKAELKSIKLSRGEIVKQISGPPATVIHLLGNYILRYVCDTNFNFLINFNIKSKSKGDQIYEKITNSIIWAPNCWPLWPYGDLPIGPQWSNFKFVKQFLNKIQIEWGLSIWGPIL